MKKTMQAVKVRRTGNSNAISLPADFEDLGYVPGAVVLVVAMPSGELRVIPQDRAAQILAEVFGGPGVSSLDFTDDDAARLLRLAAPAENDAS